MKLHKIGISGIITALLCGCSSPPEPPQAEWNKGKITINNEIPDITDRHNVISAQNITGHWKINIGYIDNSLIRPPEVWFAIVHSTEIVISAQDSDHYFSTKSWLLNHGATAKIITYKQSSLTNQTNITLIR